MNSFYTRDGDQFVATPLTRGPWDNRFQHGGPPSALLASALESFENPDGVYAVSKLTIGFHRPVPIGTCAVDVRPQHMGKTVQRLEATLHVDGTPVLTATALRTRQSDAAPATERSAPPWPAPEAASSFEFPFFIHPIGYHTAIDVRIARGAWGTTPITCWARPRVPLVEGRALTPLERVVILVDAQSGMGTPLDPRDYTYVNPDLTVFLYRALRGEWVGLDILSNAGPQGAGLARSDLHDTLGPIGLSAQSLVVGVRKNYRES